jgi:SAM-dependent methyltransferase
MVGELVFARALARHCGVADRLHCVAGLAEELPIRDEFFDVVYSQGCVHHWVVDLALPECARVLRPGGRFAAVEPWRAPLYGIGTKILGKRDTGVQCVVLTADRIEPYLDCLSEPRVIHHGALSRYPIIGLSKFGLDLQRPTLWKIGELDDRLSARVPALGRSGSSVAILASAPHPAANPAPQETSQRSQSV